MNKIQHLLTLLSEECNETGQRASKAIRFTPEEIQEGQELTNSERITYEFNDIVAVMELLQDEGVLLTVIDRVAIETKKEKIKKYMDYSVEMGTLNLTL